MCPLRGESAKVLDEREQRVYEVYEREGRFRPQAYFMIFMALARCRMVDGKPGHVSGKELLRAFAEEARSQYGPMALEVLQHLGLKNTRDIGNLVFLMVREGLLSRTAADSQQDFENGYDFEEEFIHRYEW